jgi:hypothetical protein
MVSPQTILAKIKISHTGDMYDAVLSLNFN